MTWAVGGSGTFKDKIAVRGFYPRDCNYNLENFSVRACKRLQSPNVLIQGLEYERGSFHQGL